MSKINVVIFGGLAALGLISGCASSTTGPGSGATEAVVKGSVEATGKKTEQVFMDMGIQLTGSQMKNGGNEREIKGKMGDTDVNVILDNAPDHTTNVEVEATKNFLNGDKTLAKQILSKIVQG
jgi:hypothetical protein